VTCRRCAGSAIGALVAAAMAAASAPARAGPTVPELVEVSDISGLSASPSGREVVFRVERASIERNSYFLDWYVADLETGTTRRIADGGGPIEGGAEPLAVEAPVWSPDERFVFHRALVDGAIGIWRTAVDGSGRWPVVIVDADVERIAAGEDAASLIYELGPSRAEIERAERSEYDDGILVDGSVDLNQNLYRGGWVNGRLASQRLTGQWVSRAGLLWRAPRQRYRLDLQSFSVTALGPDVPPPAQPLTPAALDVAMVLDRAGRPPVRVHRRADRSTIEVEQGGAWLACSAAACMERRIAAIAWRPESEQLAFTTQDAHYRQSLHLWDLASDTVRTVVRAGGLIAGSRDPSQPCALTSRAATCVTASAVGPPRLEAIDLYSGARTVLFDPNTTLRDRAMPRVEQLTWRMDDGREATGTVLLPPTALRAPAPMFVTYYSCPGYLRGGVGDEFPLAPLADAGFVVACLNMVPDEGVDMVASYRAGLESVETLVDHLTARGWVDPSRIGMGGFSHGSEVTMWVAMNSQLLAAASIASPQFTPSGYWSNALPGRDFTGVLRAFFGLASPDEAPERWRVVSPALNTGRIDAPLLMQMPENEARAQAEVYARLALTATPVELYAFPDENHVKFQPRHRLATYRRNLDWFRYWLQGVIDPDPAKAGQYGRWQEMRAKRDEGQPSNERSHVSAEAKSISRM
jgi:dipeptidyl aminopeptidase/acylaminoacyl peptidase